MAERGPERQPELTPEQSSALERLLGDLADVDPIPPEVAARLDETVARLAAARDSSAMVDLGAARRRRRWTMGVAAAAAASVVAVGFGSLSSQTHFGNSASSSTAAGDSAGLADGGAEGAPQADVPKSGPTDGFSEGFSEGSSTRGSDRPQPASGLAPSQARAVSPPVFTQRDFASEVAAWYSAGDDASLYDWSGACAVPGIPASARRYAAFYDGAPSVLIVLPPRGDTQTIEIAHCSGDGKVLNSTQVTVP